MCHHYHSAKSISGSKNLMYSAAAVALRKFKKKVYNRNRWIKSSSECCWKETLQLKVGALTQQPKNGWTSHFIKNNFVKILKMADH